MVDESPACHRLCSARSKQLHGTIIYTRVLCVYIVASNDKRDEQIFDVQMMPGNSTEFVRD